MHPHLPFAVACLATALSAQSSYVPNNTPSTGTVNIFPFGTSDMRYQALVTANDLGNTPALITGFGLAPGATGVRDFTSVRMKLAHLASPTLSTTFDQNLAAGATTTMDVTNWSWHLTADTWNDVDLQVPFFYNGVDNLVVEFLVTGSSGVSGGMHREGTNQRVYLGSYTGQPTGTNGGNTAFKMRVITGDASTGRFGRGCSGSTSLTPVLTFGGSSQLGQTLQYLVANCQPTVPAFLALGTYSGTPFPIDLTPYGMPGCTGWFAPLLNAVAVTDNAGAASLSVAVPNNATFVGFAFYTQWFPFDLTTGSLLASNYGRVLVGN